MKHYSNPTSVPHINIINPQSERRSLITLISENFRFYFVCAQCCIQLLFSERHCFLMLIRKGQNSPPSVWEWSDTKVDLFHLNTISRTFWIANSSKDLFLESVPGMARSKWDLPCFGGEIEYARVLQTILFTNRCILYISSIGCAVRYNVPWLLFYLYK